MDGKPARTFAALGLGERLGRACRRCNGRVPCAVPWELVIKQHGLRGLTQVPFQVVMNRLYAQVQGLDRAEGLFQVASARSRWSNKDMGQQAALG